MDPTEKAFLEAIVAEPDDDTRRLVLADWLDETAGIVEIPCPACSQYASDPVNPYGAIGYRPERDPASGWSNCKTCNSGGKEYVRPGVIRQPNHGAERAAWIRLGCELAALPACRYSLPCCDRHQAEKATDIVACERCQTVFRLRDRQRHFVTEYGLDALAGFELPEHATLWPAGELHTLRSFGVRFARGFIEALQCTTVNFLEHGHRLALCPLREVRLTDKQPANRVNMNGMWYWFRFAPAGESENHLPVEIFQQLVGFHADTIGLPFSSQAAALDALSIACIRHLRQPVVEALPEQAYCEQCLSGSQLASSKVCQFCGSDRLGRRFSSVAPALDPDGYRYE